MPDDPPEMLDQPALVLHTTSEPDMMAGRNGGLLRRGNPGNKGRPKSQVAKDILEAGTPEAARKLSQMSLQGCDDKGEPLSHPDRIKAITAHLDRGGVPTRTEVSGADGAPFVVAVTAARPVDKDV